MELEEYFSHFSGMKIYTRNNIFNFFCKLEVLQEAISLVKGSLKRRCVASCKKKLPRVTAPLV